MIYEWDEQKRKINLTKHGLDFIDAWKVFEAKERLDIVSHKGNEQRTVSFAYIDDKLTVLMLVHTPRNNAIRCISFRHASKEERKVYDDWKNSINDD